MYVNIERLTNRVRLERDRGAFYERNRHYSLAASCYRIARKYMKILRLDTLQIDGRIVHCEGMAEQEMDEE